MSNWCERCGANLDLVGKRHNCRGVKPGEVDHMQTASFAEARRIEKFKDVEERRIADKARMQREKEAAEKNSGATPRKKSNGGRLHGQGVTGPTVVGTREGSLSQVGSGSNPVPPPDKKSPQSGDQGQLGGSRYADPEKRKAYKRDYMREYMRRYRAKSA